MSGTEMFDVLWIDPDEQRSVFDHRSLGTVDVMRVAHRASGRAALASFERARFDAIVCRPQLGDVAYGHWVRMIRSGKFGYAATPVIVLCDSIEEQELRPMVDEHTLLVSDSNGTGLNAAFDALKTGTAKPSLLVIEDEVTAAVAASKALEKVYRVELAHDGTTALNAWRERRHKLVLLDLMLPDMPGLDVLKTMIAEQSEQIVIVLTAHDAPDQHQELVLGGAMEFLSKPLDMHFLPEICARALRARQCMDNAERSRRNAQTTLDFAARTRVAHYLIERGQTARGHAHLRQALFRNPAQSPDDDRWASLLAEFDNL